MAHSLSAKKRVRQTVEHRARNRWRLRALREAMKEFLDKLAHGTVAEAKASYLKAASVVDRTAQKGVIHKKQASRRKSRMSARLKAKAVGAKA
jgi:small subunit ribosomal protein S20